MLHSEVTDEPGSPQAPVVTQLALVRLHDLLVSPSLVLDEIRLIGTNKAAAVAGVVLLVRQLVGEVFLAGGVLLSAVSRHHVQLLVGEHAELAHVGHEVPGAGLLEHGPAH